MNRIIVTLLVALTAICSQAQTLHAIVFADTKDGNVGAYDYQDYLNVTMEVNTIASAIGMRLQPYFYKDENCSPANLKKVLDNMRTKKDDIVIFYYSGHGARSSRDNSKYPQMCLASHYQENFYPLEGVLNKLKSQPARLKIVLGDCCNSVAPGISPKEYATKGATVLTKEPVNSYRNLFYGNSGVIIASSSMSGETSSTVSWQNGQPAGGAFTVSLLATLQTVVKNNLNSSWDEILLSARDMTKQLRHHTPVYDVQLKATSVPAATAGPQNTSQANPPQSASQQDDEMESIDILTALGNEKMSVEKRVELMDAALEVLFASPQAKVEVVGRNGTTIVATETAKDFVLRLTTTHKLVRLVELDKKVDSGNRYEYLRVHEIYSGY